MEITLILIFNMTDLSASNDVIMIFFNVMFRKKTFTSSFLKFHSLICLQFINFIYTANYSTWVIRMLPQELQSIARLATYAD